MLSNHTLAPPQVFHNCFVLISYSLPRAASAHLCPCWFLNLILKALQASKSQSSEHIWLCASGQEARALFNKASPLPRAATKWTVTMRSQLEPACWHCDSGFFPSPALSQFPGLKCWGRPQACCWISWRWQAHASQGVSFLSDISSGHPACEVVLCLLQRKTERFIQVGTCLLFPSGSCQQESRQGKGNTQQQHARCKANYVLDLK